MKPADELERENRELRDRLSRLSQASIRINASLDFERVLQEVLDGACSLTHARYGAITLTDETGQVQNLVTSGLAPEEISLLPEMPDGDAFLRFVGGIADTIRLRDFQGYTRTLGLPEFRPPMPVSPSMSFMAVPIKHLGERVGGIYVGEKENGREFTLEDEETLMMFASQAAMVIANARRYRDEKLARTDLETLMDTSPVGVLVFDAVTGTLISSNREATRIVKDLPPPGSSLEELIPALSFQRTDGRQISRRDLPLVRTLSTGETVRAETIILQGADGRRVTTLVNATPVFDDDGDIESVVITLQDMTPLEEMERLRAEFLAMVSHELRTPLTSIKGSADTLIEAESRLDPAEMLQLHRIIKRQADHMRGLITDLLDLARIETGTFPVSPRPAQIAQLVEEARILFITGEGEANLQIELSESLPTVMADPRRIVQVLSNLLANAKRYSPADTAIMVSAAREGSHVAVSVVDEGRGVPAELLPHLFRKFFRPDGERDLQDLGAPGLGLAISKGIVEAHGGRIWAESAGIGMGTRFTFTIPVAEGEPDQKPVSSTAAEPATRQKRCILVVDDDPQTLRHVRESLSGGEYELVMTGDPDEVPLLMAARRPHLVLLDLMLPQVDGVELMREILSMADVPIVFISIYGQDQIIARVLDAGAADYLVKPFSPTELTARIRLALRKLPDNERNDPTEPYVLGDMEIDFGKRVVKVVGSPVPLTGVEYRLLRELAVNAGQVLTYRELLRRVWDTVGSRDLRPMRTTVRNLRRKLGDDANNPKYIFNEARVGYRMPRSERREPVATSP